MPSETVRIRPETHAKLKELAEQSGLSMPRLLEKAGPETQEPLFARIIGRRSCVQ